MSGRFAGSKSLDERRRRRLAADEAKPSGKTPLSDPERSLPARRPTGRFPLRRVVSRSPWKLVAVALAALFLSGGALVAGHRPSIQSGAFGPGVAAFCSVETGRLVTSLAGLLLLAAGQLAWLIRWARARSMRDFRGGYRIWWWASLALVVGGLALLTDAHVAFGVTVAWLSGRTPFGSDALFRLLPAAVTLLILLPMLQRDMRGCRTSRRLLLTAAGLWCAGGVATLAAAKLDEVLVGLGLGLPAIAVTRGLLLIGTATAFSGLLFHARYVIYESVEPPEPPVRLKKPAKGQQNAEATDSKTASSRKATRARTADRVMAAATVVEKPLATDGASTKPVTKPHFAVKTQPNAASPTKVEPAATKAKPAPPTPAAAPSKPSQNDDDETEVGETMVDLGGRQVRLDGPEDALRGLSKRERRKLRKAMRERGQADD